MEEKVFRFKLPSGNIAELAKGEIQKFCDSAIGKPVMYNGKKVGKIIGVSWENGVNFSMELDKNMSEALINDHKNKRKV